MNLQTIKDTYAKEQGYEGWEDLRIEFYGDARPLRIEEFMNEICIRAQKAALEKAAENGVAYKAAYPNNTSKAVVEKDSITNPENLIR